MKEDELIRLICEHWNSERFRSEIALDRILGAIRENYASPNDDPDSTPESMTINVPE